jgi:hypothetical protein
MRKANLENQIIPHVFYAEYDNLPGGSNTIWTIPQSNFGIPIGFNFVLSNVRVIVERINYGFIRGPFDVSLSIEQAARAMRQMENGYEPVRLYGGFVSNEDRGSAGTNNENFPLSSVVSWDEFKRPIPYGDTIQVTGQFISNSANSGAKKIGIALLGNFVPVELGK